MMDEIFWRTWKDGKRHRWLPLRLLREPVLGLGPVAQESVAVIPPTAADPA